MDLQKKEIQAAEYCRANSCKGYKAIADVNLQYCKDARTINAHLEKEVVAGEKQRILTVHEERTLVRYLINRNQACQRLNTDQVSGGVLNILRVRKERNRKHSAKLCLTGKRISLSENGIKVL